MVDENLHLVMHANPKHRLGIGQRLGNAWRALFGKGDDYGMAWGDPERVPPLAYFRDEFLLPFVSSDQVIVEIGPGGGRWTGYLLGAKKIYAVDLYQELLDELHKNYRADNLHLIKNSGSDFPGIESASIDFIFSFGVFVHLEQDVILEYLQAMKKIIKPGGNIVLQYSDKTKPMAKANAGFTQNDPETMRAMVRECGFEIYAEDTASLWHSAVIRFGL